MTAPLILGTNSIKDTGYNVANSARFDDGSSDNLQRTYGTPTNAKIFGLSWWVKLGKAFDGSGSQDFWGERAGSGDRVFMGINADGTFEYFEKDGGSTVLNIKTNRLFRDNSAWFHFLLLGDSTQGTNSNRLKLYINGVQETSFATESYPAEDYTFRLAIGSSTKYYGRIGLGGGLSTNYYDGYLCEAVFVDGTVTAHTDYGEFDSDTPTIWKPIDVSGLTFGNNGFYLDFEDSSALGNDAAGSNNFTVNNLTAADQTTDTCTNNFATLNPLLDVNATPTLTEGNLVFQGTGSTNFAGATIPVSSGKWYVEVKATTVNGSYPIIGVIDSQSSKRRDSTYFVGSDINTNNPSGFAVFSNGDIYHNGDNNFSDLTTTYTSGDIIGMALNMDASPNTLGFYKNGTLEVTINLDTAPSGAYMFAASVHASASSAKGEFNFGNPTFTISSGNSDGEGFGNFEFAVPSNYFALCTKNLAEYG
jgi:hypothetical protein